MTQPQQGDVVLYQSIDDGEIEVVNGVVTMDGGLQTSVYNSLFGGNMEDDGLADNAFNWWGNMLEIDPDEQLRSETQNILRSIPATAVNLLRIQAAVLRDLQWMITKKVANEIDAAVSIPALNKIKIVVTINAIGPESSFEFVENWGASS